MGGTPTTLRPALSTSITGQPQALSPRPPAIFRSWDEWHPTTLRPAAHGRSHALVVSAVFSDHRPTFTVVLRSSRSMRCSQPLTRCSWRFSGHHDPHGLLWSSPNIPADFQVIAVIATFFPGFQVVAVHAAFISGHCPRFTMAGYFFFRPLPDAHGGLHVVLQCSPPFFPVNARCSARIPSFGHRPAFSVCFFFPGRVVQPPLPVPSRCLTSPSG